MDQPQPPTTTTDPIDIPTRHPSSTTTTTTAGTSIESLSFLSISSTSINSDDELLELRTNIKHAAVLGIELYEQSEESTRRASQAEEERESLQTQCKELRTELDYARNDRARLLRQNKLLIDCLDDLETDQSGLKKNNKQLENQVYGLKKDNVLLVEKGHEIEHQKAVVVEKAIGTRFKLVIDSKLMLRQQEEMIKKLKIENMQYYKEMERKIEEDERRHCMEIQVRKTEMEELQVELNQMKIFMYEFQQKFKRNEKTKFFVVMSSFLTGVGFGLMCKR